MNDTSDRDALWKAVARFIRWLENEGYASHDPYDIWGTKFGVAARRIYYRTPTLGMPLIAPILLFEVFAPRLRSLLVARQRFATADAHLLMASLQLHTVTQDADHLDRARQLAEGLLRASIPGFSGLCWGYPFDWQNSAGLWRRNTPFITATPYCYEALCRLGDAIRDERYFESARSAAKFVHDDLNDTPTSKNAAAASYSPFVRDKVINASAYRAFVLFDAADRFGLEDYRVKAGRNLRFILEQQEPNGSWLYEAGTKEKSFIDHFHTCFVLKNLFKINRHLQDDAVRSALHKGYDYYRRNLFFEDGLPRYFSIEPRLQITRLEMYNVAEAITLGVLLKDEIPAAYEIARDLGQRVCREFQLSDGHFVTRVYRGGLRHKMAFLRWPQAQLFYALTSLLAAQRSSTLQGDADDAASKSAVVSQLA